MPEFGVETLFVVALHEEARPLNRLLRLQADESARGFRCFRRDGLHLIVSGPGRERAGLATAYGAARLERSDRALFINVGVAGSGLAPTAYPLGSPLLAHQITERQSGRKFYPSVAFEPPVPTAAVVTCDEVETEYAEPVLYEMEAGGFYSAARRFATAELIQSMKVISDHAESPVDQLDAASITRVIEEALPSVRELLSRLEGLAGELDDSAAATLAARWAASRRLSKTQQRRLEAVARRLLALGDDQPSPELLAQHTDSRSLLAALESYVDDLSVRSPETAP